MIKLIARLSNAIRDRRKARKETTGIKVGECYFVKHSYKQDFYIKVKKFNDAWVEGFVIDAETLAAGEEEVTLLRQLCKFRKLEGRK